MRPCEISIGIKLIRRNTEPDVSGGSTDLYSDSSAELMDFLGMLYFIIEVLRTDETLGDELSMYDSTSTNGSDDESTTARGPLPDGSDAKGQAS
jgi:hypothetical protein